MKNNTIKQKNINADTIQRRCDKIVKHLEQKTSCHEYNTSSSSREVFDVDTSSMNVKWNGWGYKDTRLFLNKNNEVEISGDRYSEIFPGERVLPKLRQWAEDVIGLNMHETSFANIQLPSIPLPNINPIFFERLHQLHPSLEISTDIFQRIHHSHGHTCNELYDLRFRKEIENIIDVILWPTEHDQVVSIVGLAKECDICLIPYGGGTNVTNALECPKNEKRMICSLDMRKMNRILWIDKENLTACVQAGIIGSNLQSQLQTKGLTFGHEPDSIEFSTLGGWISTRASGMKKNRYGNIEDLVKNIVMVTPSGVLSKSCVIPRCSMGPDVSQLLMGSEGILGVITSAVIQLQPLPSFIVYDSILFPSFETGVRFMKDVTRQKLIPASIRLMDNLQFQLGQVLKPHSVSPITDSIIDAAKKFYVTKYKNFKINQMCAATIVFEGEKVEIYSKQKKIHHLVKKHGGIITGEENGKRGYFLTYLIAYLRDFAFDYHFMSESFETSVPWSNVISLIQDIKQSIAKETSQYPIKKEPFVCCRVTQVYETGVCVYVYFGIITKDLIDPQKVFEKVEDAAVYALLRNGAALSHHHGIGKHRKKWISNVISNTSLSVISSIKKTLDPNQNFVSGNILPSS